MCSFCYAPAMAQGLRPHFPVVICWVGGGSFLFLRGQRLGGAGLRVAFFDFLLVLVLAVFTREGVLHARQRTMEWSLSQTWCIVRDDHEQSLTHFQLQTLFGIMSLWVVRPKTIPAGAFSWSRRSLWAACHPLQLNTLRVLQQLHANSYWFRNICTCMRKLICIEPIQICRPTCIHTYEHMFATSLLKAKLWADCVLSEQWWRVSSSTNKNAGGHSIVHILPCPIVWATKLVKTLDVADHHGDKNDDDNDDDLCDGHKDDDGDAIIPLDMLLRLSCLAGGSRHSPQGVASGPIKHPQRKFNLFLSHLQLGRGTTKLQEERPHAYTNTYML